MNGKFPNDGIDYALLSRDRNKCTPQELDRIRKERNRMHAKRTRDRKKIFIQEVRLGLERSDINTPPNQLTNNLPLFASLAPLTAHRRCST